MRHGTTSGYITHKCRCDECRAAIRDYERDRVRGIHKLVDAEEVRAHIRMLTVKRRMTHRAIEREAGVARGTVYGIVTRRAKVFPDTADAILAVVAYEKPTGLTDARPVQRLILAMRAAGLTTVSIGAACGHTRGWVTSLMKRRLVTERNRALVVTLYRMLVRERVVPANVLLEVIK